jgi:hypothetical protein
MACSRRETEVTAQKSVTRPSKSRHNRSELFKDEVYRQMFRLVARRPGAETDLSVALLRAWIALGSASRSSKEWKWLQKICPICLVMIEAALQAGETSRQSIQ